MSVRMRLYSGTNDQTALLALARATRADNLHVADLPYRLASWAFDYPANVGLWEDDMGQLLAWAVLNTPFWTLDYVYNEAARDLGLGPAILTWAVSRAAALAGQPNGRPLWLVSVRADQADRCRDLERAGFADQGDVADNPMSQVLLVRPAGEPVPSSSLPDGFTLRPLAGPAEGRDCAALHRAAFDSPSMTDAWRARVLTTPGYRPDLDLVVVAPDGQLAAYCLGWLDPSDPAGPLGHIEPLASHPDFAGLGLGRAVLAETLRRLYATGATRVLVETDSYRDAAQNVYAGMGFTLQHEIRVYRRDFPTAVPASAPRS